MNNEMENYIKTLEKDLKEKADSWVTMIKEREQLINEQSKKIRELTEVIQRKDDQLKLMMNSSNKEINEENKYNIKEVIYYKHI